MKELKTVATLGATVGIVVFLFALPGCENGGLCGCKSQTQAKAAASDVPLCTACGQIKGSPQCCKPGQPTCSKCELVKGSPGCCVIKKGSAEPVALCKTCGQLKGSELCCKPGQPVCSKCTLVKGSPGCCKI